MTTAHEPPARGWLRRALLPPEVTRDARVLLTARALRGGADGLVSVLLAVYLRAIGFTPLQIGAVITATLIGSAALTLVVGLAGSWLPRRRLLIAAAGLMVATGLGFASTTVFWVVLIVAVVGTLNPSAGDVSVFLPTEQALLPSTVAPLHLTALFARYNLAGALAGAFGALLTSGSGWLAGAIGWSLTSVQRLGFLVYAAVGLIAGWQYATLSPAVEQVRSTSRGVPLRASRGVVLRLAALFSLDSFGGGFAVQSLLALWLLERYHLSLQTTGIVFFAAGVLSAWSQLGSSWLAARIGLIPTMVYTHLPSNLLLIAVPLMPSAPWALGLLLLRMALSQMDVPARQSYVMSVVTPEERPAAASVTNVPRSLAAALAPLLAGWMLGLSSFGWMLICAGGLKAVYDLLLLAQFRHTPATHRSVGAA